MEINDKFVEVPGRLHSVAIEGQVAGADEIYDDVLEKTQTSINVSVNTTIGTDSNKGSLKGRIKSLEGKVGSIENTIGVGGAINERIANAVNEEKLRAQSEEAERYLKIETYSKEETDALISNTPETNVVILDVAAGSTVIDTLNAVPVEDRPNKLFWVRNEDNTSFDEYGWTGSKWALLGSHSYGIDDEPIEGSNNLVTSDGMAKLVVRKQSDIGKFFLVDGEGSIIQFLDKDEVMRMNVKLSVDNIEAGSITFKASNFPAVYNQGLMAYSETGDLLFGYDSTRDRYLGLLKKPKSTFEQNTHKNAELLSAKGINNDFQFLVCTDTHENISEYGRFIAAGHDFESIDALVYLGDIMNRDVLHVKNYMDCLSAMTGKSTKPFYYVCGNHEAGDERRAVYCCASDLQLYDWFIKPMVENHWLSDGEYTEGKLYYSHVFNNKVMLIVLYPFDDSNCIMDNGRVVPNIEAVDDAEWIPIPYSSSYPNVASNTQYHAGDIVNVKNYKDFSFQARYDIKTRSVTWGSANGWNCDNYPRYRMWRSVRWYSKTQLEWFCNRLEYASANNLKVIVAQHLPFSVNVNSVPSSVFSDGVVYSSLGNYGYRYNDGNTDVIADIINACMNKQVYGGEGGMVFKPSPWTKTDTTEPVTEDVSKLVPSYEADNPSGEVRQFTFRHDFTNTEGSIGGLFHINGHYHRGVMMQHKSYDQKGLLTDAGKIASYQGEPCRSGNEDSPSFDSMNVFTVKDGGIYLTRLGSDCTQRQGEDGRLIRRDNEFINF